MAFFITTAKIINKDCIASKLLLDLTPHSEIYYVYGY